VIDSLRPIETLCVIDPRGKRRKPWLSADTLHARVQARVHQGEESLWGRGAAHRLSFDLARAFRAIRARYESLERVTATGGKPTGCCGRRYGRPQQGERARSTDTSGGAQRRSAGTVTSTFTFRSLGWIVVRFRDAHSDSGDGAAGSFGGGAEGCVVSGAVGAGIGVTRDLD